MPMARGDPCESQRDMGTSNGYYWLISNGSWLILVQTWLKTVVDKLFHELINWLMIGDNMESRDYY